MALKPGFSPTRLTKGSDGRVFKGMGYRGLSNEERRVSRTGVRLNTTNHDTSNISYWLDSRLPVAFRYNYAEMYNQVVIPKGRIVAVDPDVKSRMENPEIFLNVLTLANGGVPVRLKAPGDVYGSAAADGLISTEASGKEVANIGTEWIPAAGYTAAYTEKLMAPFRGGKTPKKLLADSTLEVDELTGLIKKDNKLAVDHRAGNVPIGILMRNEYTRDEDAWNGMTPGAIKTDVLVELPHFQFKDKAEQNPWGSVYGKLKPGDFVKSDENGRLVKSPLSDDDAVAAMDIAEYNAEMQQVVGQVHEVSPNLVPEGSTKWMKWATEDMENFVNYASDGYGATNRRGEDIYDTRAYYRNIDGYDYNQLYSEHDLNMTATNNKFDIYDTRMGAKYEFPGIIGLTDGRNVAQTQCKDVLVGYMHKAGDKEYVDFNFRIPDRFIVANTAQISINGSAYTPIVEGAIIENAFEVVYFNEENGLIRLHVTDKAAADGVIAADQVEVKVTYSKAGLAGVPTFMDWDGCVGSVKVLLQK